MSTARPFVVSAAAVAALVALAIIVILASQGRPRYQVVDGFPIGGSPDCGECSAEIAMATAALDARDRSHATVVSATPYRDIDPCRDGYSSVLCVRDSHVVVVVFRLADGSTRATGVACIGVSPCAGTGTYPFDLP